MGFWGLILLSVHPPKRISHSSLRHYSKYFAKYFQNDMNIILNYISMIMMMMTSEVVTTLYQSSSDSKTSLSAVRDSTFGLILSYLLFLCRQTSSWRRRRGQDKPRPTSSTDVEPELRELASHPAAPWPQVDPDMHRSRVGQLDLGAAGRRRGWARDNRHQLDRGTD